MSPFYLYFLLFHLTYMHTIFFLFWDFSVEFASFFFAFSLSSMLHWFYINLQGSVCPGKVEWACLPFSSNALFHISCSRTHSRLGAAQSNHSLLLLAPDSICGTLCDLNVLHKGTLPAVEEVEESVSPFTFHIGVSSLWVNLLFYWL